MALRTAASMGAKGDGKINDSPAIQAGLDKLKEGDEVSFAGSKTYKLNKGLTSYQRNIRFEFEGAGLLLNTSNWPDNTHLRIRSRIDWDEPTATWTAAEPIQQGWFKLPAKSTSWMWFAFGVDPHDKNEEHYGVLVAPGTDRVWLPYDIGVAPGIVVTDPKASLKVQAFTVQQLCEGVSVNNVRIAVAPGISADMNISFDTVRNVSLDGLTGDVTIGVQLINTEYATLRGLNAKLLYTSGSTGTILRAWQSRYVNVADAKWSGDRSGKGGDGIFLESWCQFINFDLLEVTRNVPGAGWGGNNFPVLFCTGGSRNVNVRHLMIKCHPTSEVYPYDRGGVPEQESPRFETIEVVSGQTGMLDWWLQNGLNAGKVIKS